jgi:hypothetical protein
MQISCSIKSLSIVGDSKKLLAWNNWAMRRENFVLPYLIFLKYILLVTLSTKMGFSIAEFYTVNEAIRMEFRVRARIVFIGQFV